MVYYLNTKKQSGAGSNYEVHTATCSHAPVDKSSLEYLGNFLTAREAVIYAKNNFLYLAVDIDGCYFCCRSENKERS